MESYCNPEQLEHDRRERQLAPVEKAAAVAKAAAAAAAAARGGKTAPMLRSASVAVKMDAKKRGSVKTVPAVTRSKQTAALSRRKAVQPLRSDAQ